MTLNAVLGPNGWVVDPITSPNSGGSGGKNRAYGLIFGDSTERVAVTPTGSITVIDSYGLWPYAKYASKGRMKMYARAGNSGFDIKETLDILRSKPPCNASTSTGSGAETSWGMAGVDFSQASFALVCFFINHMADFDFTTSDLTAREATNSVKRANVLSYARQFLSQLSMIPEVWWATQGPVGPGSVNFNGGDTIERGYIWHEKWWYQTLNDLSTEFKNLRVLNLVTNSLDTTNAQFLPKQYYTLTTDGTLLNQDMHPGFVLNRLNGNTFWGAISESLNDSVPMGIPLSASAKLSISKDSYNVHPDSLLLGSTVAAKVLYGGGNSTTAPITTGITGVMPPEMAAQANVTSGDVTIVSKVIDSPSGFGKAIQIDFTATKDLDASFGVSGYFIGQYINAMISAGYLTFNEAKVIQACMYFRAGLAGGSDGQVTDVSALRQFGFNMRVRTTSNNQFDTATTYGPSNASTDYSTNNTGLQLPGSVDGVFTTPPMKIDGITPATPNQMQTRTMASPNTSEYFYAYAVAKVLNTQVFRVIVGNVGIYVAPMRADGLIPDII